MNKVRIKIATLGHIPLDLKDVRKWNSELFEIVGISSHPISIDSDLQDWRYSDNSIEKLLPKNDGEDILLAITNVPIELNYYCRRLNGNRVCLSLFGMDEILTANNIPFKNLILLILYTIYVVYKQENNFIPSADSGHRVTHDETRGCLFDFTGIKSDVIHSLHKPQLCSSCVEKLITHYRMDRNLIRIIQKELSRIRKTKYAQIISWIKRHPIGSIIISSAWALILGLLGSIFANYLMNI